MVETLKLSKTKICPSDILTPTLPIEETWKKLQTFLQNKWSRFGLKKGVPLKVENRGKKVNQRCKGEQIYSEEQFIVVTLKHANNLYTINLYGKTCQTFFNDNGTT